jgi:hypothetical protein
MVALALGLYKQYLGEHAKGLPATGLLFPLSVRVKRDETPLVLTILAVDEQQQSMTFAGDVCEGAHARLTKANIDRLIDGAVGAARPAIRRVAMTRMATDSACTAARSRPKKCKAPSPLTAMDQPGRGFYARASGHSGWGTAGRRHPM